MKLRVRPTAEGPDLHSAVLPFTTERFHDPWWLPNSRRAECALSEAIAIASVAADAMRKRRRRPKDQARFVKQVTAYVCDLWQHQCASIDEAIVVTRAKSKLDATKGRYDHPDMTGSAVAAQDALVKSGLCQIAPGAWGGSQAYGKSSALAATPLLRGLFQKAQRSDFLRDPAEEVIILRGEKGDLTDDGQSRETPGTLIEYADDENTRRMRQQLRVINKHLEEADIEFDEGVLASFTNDRFNPASRRLYRIFANGRFDNGGRLYRGFWIGLPSASRSDVLQIDGEPIVILDYGQMSARLAYAQVTVRPPAGDLYAVAEMETWPRDGVKKLFNAALFSSSPIVRKPKGTKKLLPSDDIAYLMSQLRKAHAPISSLFECGEGLRIQRTESDIMVEVLLRLTEMRVTALPIHDAIIVAEPHRLRAEAVMREVFQEMSGVEAAVSVDV